MSDIVERLRNWHLDQPHPDAILQEGADEIEQLRTLLKEARQYVSDAGMDEGPEAQSHSQSLLAEIDAAITKGRGSE